MMSSSNTYPRREERETYRCRHALSATALTAANHRSTTPNRNKPTHAPAIAPRLAGTHPRNQSVSPPNVKCRYGRIAPAAKDMEPSMDMSIPLSAARTARMAPESIRKAKLRVIRCDRCGMLGVINGAGRGEGNIQSDCSY
jgi:hypothetical protein